MAGLYQQHHNQPSEKDPEAQIGELVIPEGYELAHYTVRRLRDGYLQSYLILNERATRVEAIPIPVQFPGMVLQRESQGDRQTHHGNENNGSLSPFPSTDNSLAQNQKPRQQTNDLRVRGDPENIVRSDNESQRLSAQTQKRHAHSRDDGYTDVCGVYSPEVSRPVRKYNDGNGDCCCPRCGSNFTRPKTVKDHFPYCVAKYGNPKALRFTDHPSMVMSEAFIQRRTRASHRTSVMQMEEDDTQMDTQGQQIKFEEMNDALSRTSLRVMQDEVQVQEGELIKTEFVFGADIAQESIETSSPECQYPSAFPDFQYPSPRSSSSYSRVHGTQTPDWHYPQEPDLRLGSSTPTPQANQWNIGVPGAEAEHAVADLRATAPFEGWPHVCQTPEPRSHNGIQNDGLDDFMDRRSYFSPTPAAAHFPETMERIYEEREMME